MYSPASSLHQSQHRLLQNSQSKGPQTAIINTIPTTSSEHPSSPINQSLRPAELAFSLFLNLPGKHGKRAPLDPIMTGHTPSSHYRKPPTPKTSPTGPALLPTACILVSLHSNQNVQHRLPKIESGPASARGWCAYVAPTHSRISTLSIIIPTLLSLSLPDFVSPLLLPVSI